MLPSIPFAALTFSFNLIRGTRIRVYRHMSQAQVVRAGSIRVGVLSERADGRAFVFHASDPAYLTLDGSSFANRHAAQRAIDRVTAAAGPISSGNPTVAGSGLGLGFYDPAA